MKHFFRVLLVLVVLCASVHRVICKRSGAGSNRRPTQPRTTPRTTHHQTTPYAYHQTSNNYQVGNPNTPSAPVLPQQNNPIGFDNVNRQNSNPIGFDNNVHNRQPQSYQPPPNAGGFNTQHGYNPQAPQTQFGGYNPQGQQPPGTWSHPTSGVNPYNTGSYTPHGGYYNPNLAQPGSYYNNFATPGGVQPQFFQPTQQSSGFGAGSLLGIAGSFGGGYLLGRLTSGGSDHKDAKDNSGKNDQPQPFIVHHYYQNSQEIPKQMTVSNESLATCNQSITQNLCVPNTFPMCFANGTIMCVTHAQFTVPCGKNNALLACIVTALPCNNGKDKTTCNSGTNFSTSTVLVPCISNVTVAGQNSVLPGSNELCITAIAEPAKKIESPVPSLVNLMTMIATLPFQFQDFDNGTTVSPNVTMAAEIKTEMPTSMVRDA